MTKTVPFEILCKSILFIDFCTVLHIEEKKIDCNFFPLLHKCKFYHYFHNLKVLIQLINYSPLRVNLIWIIPKFQSFYSLALNLIVITFGFYPQENLELVKL